MASSSGNISDGIENLCLVEERRDDGKATLGAIPKVQTKTRDLPPPSITTPESLSPSVSRKHQKKKNRKDRRRCDQEDSEASKSQQMSKVEKLRAERGVQRSNSDRKQPSSSDNDNVAQLLFKSSSSISVNTGIKNLPESFFSDKLPEELQEDTEEKEKGDSKENKKRRRRKQKRKQISTEEEDKQSSEKENIEVEDKLNDKLIDDDVGEEIVTGYGDDQCVVSGT